jgi:hypothetical protein
MTEVFGTKLIRDKFVNVPFFQAGAERERERRWTQVQTIEADLRAWQCKELWHAWLMADEEGNRPSVLPFNIFSWSCRLVQAQVKLRYLPVPTDIEFATVDQGFISIRLAVLHPENVTKDDLARRMWRTFTQQGGLQKHYDLNNPVTTLHFLRELR